MEWHALCSHLTVWHHKSCFSKKQLLWCLIGTGSLCFCWNPGSAVLGRHAYSFLISGSLLCVSISSVTKLVVVFIVVRQYSKDICLFFRTSLFQTYFSCRVAKFEVVLLVRHYSEQIFHGELRFVRQCTWIKCCLRFPLLFRIAASQVSHIYACVACICHNHYGN
jgi:hypothetical protein